MSDLPRDPRGYPIPWIVLRGDDGTAHFVCNDTSRTTACALKRLCGICGKPLLKLAWLVGGVQNAFHRRGAYVDPPMHDECAHYALTVCPYIALRSYLGANIEKAQQRALDGGAAALLVDRTQTPGKPRMFVAVCSEVEVVDPHPLFRPVRPYRRVEYWRDGERMRWREARDLRHAIMTGELSPTFGASDAHA